MLQYYANAYGRSLVFYILRAQGAEGVRKRSLGRQTKVLLRQSRVSNSHIFCATEFSFAYNANWIWIEWP